MNAILFYVEMSNEFYQIKWNEHSSYRVQSSKNSSHPNKYLPRRERKLMDTSKWFKPKVKHFAFQFQVPNNFAVQCSLVRTQIHYIFSD